MTNPVFTEIRHITFPESVDCDAHGMSPAFSVTFETDGEVPFPQIILRQQGQEFIARDEAVSPETAYTYTASIPEGVFTAGQVQIQVEGCRKADIARSGGDDWIKTFAEMEIRPATATASCQTVEVGDPAPVDPKGKKIYFGIHKHMHQPYYHAADTGYWDGEKDEIFGSRCGPYTHFVPAAVRQYAEGGLPHGGLSTSWSGTLIEQLNRCRDEGLCGGAFGSWSDQLRSLAQEKTALGHPRLGFSAFGFFHPLMALIPQRNIVKQIEMHRQLISETFGSDALRILFPPETAFHARMIPALNEAGIRAVIYDSIHRFRSCKDYPYAGIEEGMLPPNPAEQENPAVSDWMQLHNIWAGSEIAPSLLRPEYVKYEDTDGTIHKTIAVPAERYIGNEDARGGFGALQYPDVLGQLYRHLDKHQAWDPEHPPFFVLHSDGDNHGGGAECYYTHNTGQLVQWLQQDGRFELTTIDDYLDRFPPDPERAIHLEPGSWSGADNGDPQFMKWFSRYNEDYSPDLNSWAVLTALQNAVHAIEDSCPDAECLPTITRLMLTAETSCYWYWTGQSVWDEQVTAAANSAYGMAKPVLDSILEKDRTGPTIFAPWVIPENPGGQTWGERCLRAADKVGVVHTFVYDIAGLERVQLVLRSDKGEQTLDMENRGLYPSQTGAAVTSALFTTDLPCGAGDVRYYIEASDKRGNVSRSSLERVFLA